MKLKTGYIILLGLALMLSCSKKYVCPAYQSAFQLDKEKTNNFFSLFKQDSLPKEDGYVAKSKYGIVENIKYRKRTNELKTVKMETVSPPPLDSLLLTEHNLDGMDSLQVDSLFTAVARSRMSFKRDQQIYMQYVGPFLEYEDEESETPPEDAEPSSEESDQDLEDETPKKRKWFWQKKKEDTDPVPIEEADAENETPN
ncbi:MAG: hypothetical protein ACNS62_04940 [Candidatus Cyclobacteriaceae bacterium M3_2C_046]